jgi:hypothetical protein
MRAGTTKRLLLGAAVTLSVVGFAGFAASRITPRRPARSSGRLLAVPAPVQQSFKRFSDSAGARLVDTLFKLGYHGGYSWDEKAGAVRPTLIVRTDSGTVADSVSGIYEGVLSMDFHHDVQEDAPSSVSLRFVNLRDSPKWILLTTDSFPEDPTAEVPLEAIRKHPRELHDAMLASFADHAEAFDFWKTLERKETTAP